MQLLIITKRLNQDKAIQATIKTVKRQKFVIFIFKH